MNSASASRGSMSISGAHGSAATQAPANASIVGYGAPMWPESFRRRIETSRSASRLSKSAMGVVERTLPCPCIGMSAVRRTVLGLACLTATCVPAACPSRPVQLHRRAGRVGQVELTVVAHTFDLANDLKIQPPEKTARARHACTRSGSAIAELVRDRLKIVCRRRDARQADMVGARGDARPAIDSDSRALCPGAAGRADRRLTLMFPYDPQHKTFLNVYENGALAAQAILDKDRHSVRVLRGHAAGGAGGAADDSFPPVCITSS